MLKKLPFRSEAGRAPVPVHGVQNVAPAVVVDRQMGLVRDLRTAAIPPDPA